MHTCLFCRQPVNKRVTGWAIWKHEGLELPVHKACTDWLVHGFQRFSPINAVLAPKEGHKKTIWGWCGVTYEQNVPNWESVTTADGRWRVADIYHRVLQMLLDRQETVIKAYCKRHGLSDDPYIIRELKQQNKNLKRIGDLLRGEAQPGDHVVFASLPRDFSWSGMSKKKPGQYLRSIARRFAERGITMHSAAHHIDWSKPSCQAFVNMSVDAGMSATEAGDSLVYYDRQGEMKYLYRTHWKHMKEHMVFKWVVQNIRENKMSPEELEKAAKSYFTVRALLSYREHGILLTKDKWRAKMESLERYYYCVECRSLTKMYQCQLCGNPQSRCRVVMNRGVVFSRDTKHLPFSEVAARMWGWYCQKWPDQEKQPWRQRTLLP